MKKEILENTVRTAQAGFTLVELLVVVAILGILGAVAVQNVSSHIAKARVTATRETIQTIGNAITTYSIDHGGKFPDSLTVLTEGTDDNPPIIDNVDGLNDAWGTPIQYEKRGRRFKLTSAGEDCEFGTDDDLSNIEAKK